MTAPKNTPARLQQNLETYRELARARRASSKLRSSSSVLMIEARANYGPPPETPSRVNISKQGGKVTVTFGDAKPLTEADKTRLFGPSSLSIPEFRTIKNSVKKPAADTRPKLNELNGSAGFSPETVPTERLGNFQEYDILRAFQRIFPADQIYSEPLRVTDKEEIADIVVITSSRILLVQAKTSPNAPGGLNNTVSRNRATVLKSMNKAIEQMRSAVRYCRSVTPLKMIVKEEEVSLPIENLEMASLIILKEMFNDQYREYSPPLFELAEETKVPCIALDYAELDMYTSWLDGEDQFFAAFNRVFEVALQRGEFPRLQFSRAES